jgi:beta-glucanase (GH16 family)
MKTLSLLLINMLIGYCIITGCNKKGSDVSGSGLTASIEDVAEERKTSSSVFRFTISLNKPASTTVTMQYTTVPGTALATTDFIPASGTLTFNSSELQKTIEVTVTGDSIRKADQIFSVQLDNAQNCTLQKSKATGTIVNKNGLYFPVNNTGYSTPLTYPGYTLTWADEFTNKVIDPASWTFESGNNSGWGNNELQSYTDRTQNVFVSQGNLILEARAELYNLFNYTSTRMITKNKKMFKFGRIDIRAKLPVGKGVWPALWMLGKNIDQVNWPACGEIDILEMLGHEPNRIYGTMHWGANTASHASFGANYLLNTGSFDQQFHVYSIIWASNSIKVLVDDIMFLNFSNTNVPGTGTYPFNNEFFFIFNIAVGGNWPGSPDATTTFPQRMVVDYVRVFQ